MLRLGLLVGLAGCSVEEPLPAAGEFQPLCGEAAPLRLLPMDPVRIPESVWTQKFGDRFVMMVHNSVFLGYDTDEVWSVGACGEDPSVLIQGVDPFVKTFEPWPDIPFACTRESGRVYALDVSGAAPANEVFSTRDCNVLSTAKGIITIAGENTTGALILQPWPDDPLSQSAEQIVLVDEVRASFEKSRMYDLLRATEIEVFAVTVAGDLVVVSLDDLGVETLAADVREFQIGPSGRYVVWQGTEITKETPVVFEGPLFLLDRQTGMTTLLDETALAYTNFPSPFSLEALGLLHYRVGADDDETNARWLRLDTLESVPISGRYRIARTIDDHRALLTANDNPLWIFDVSTGELTLLYDGPIISSISRDDSILIQRELGGELIDLSYDGESRTLARHVLGRWNLLAGDRVITPYAVDDKGIGSLIVVDPDTLQERYIDHDVLGTSMSTPDRTSIDELGDLVGYMVVSEDPARHGIWLAKPADKAHSP